jgi:hypothetical protein
MTKTTYEISVSVTVSSPDGVISAEDAVEALEALIEEIKEQPYLVGRFQNPQVEPEPDTWVLRSTIRENEIRRADGGWISVDPENISDRDMVSSKDAFNMSPGGGQDSLWCRPEDINGLPLTAIVKDDLSMVVVTADIRSWLKTATSDQIEELVSDGWEFGYGADAIYHDLEKAGDPNVMRVANFIGLNPEQPNGDAVGFSVSVCDPQEVTDFLRDNRPDIDRSIYEDHSPQP